MPIRLTAVVSHDAGGAEVVSSHVRRTAGPFVCVLDGPARAVFQRKNIQPSDVPLEMAIEQADAVLCSMSWQSDLEYRAVQQARGSNKHVVVFLDHWVNYRGRLVRSASSLMPDEIWVGDRYAYELAAREFPGVLVRQVANYFWHDVEEEVRAFGPARRSSVGGVDILYVGEIIEEFSLSRGVDAPPYNYTERLALEYFLDNLAIVFESVNSVTIRPHPAEPPDKYAWATRRYGSTVRSSSNATLVEDICNADVVVGCESMAMVLGVIAGKRVLCSIPPGGKPCALPHPEIESLRTLLSAGAEP
jgi:hypothetical protein